MILQQLEYQEKGACFLAERSAALLADEPRLGKTIQAIRACDKAMVLKVLIICPAGVVENWKRKIAELREGDWRAYVTSYERAAGSDFFRLMADEFDVLIIDECHYLKSQDAKRTKAVYGEDASMTNALASRAAQVWLLSGTPMPGNPSELFTHLRALYPKALLSKRTGQPWTIEQFKAHYCTMKPTGFGMKITGSKNEAELNTKLQDFMLRRRKADVLKHIPKTIFDELWLEGDVKGVTFEEVEMVREALAKHGVEGLRKVLPHSATLRRVTGMAKAAPMGQWLVEWLANNPAEDKIVVFAHHHEVIEAMYDKVHASFVRVNKYSKKAERQAALDRFDNDPTCRGIICRMTGEGVGISLARSSESVIVEASWTPSDNDQVAERIVDLSKTRQCFVRFATIAGSIDEDIQRAVARKMQSIARVVDGVAA